MLTTKDIQNIVNTIQNDNNLYWNLDNEYSETITDFCNDEGFSFVEAVDFLTETFKA